MNTYLLSSAGNDAELELAVFRFTLGIPGFDDTYIPRVVGSLGILVLLANHLLGPDTVSDTQVIEHAVSEDGAVAAAPIQGLLATKQISYYLADSAMTVMQTRSEAFAAALAAICIASPTVEARLKELEPGRGRQAAPQQVQGATSIFAITDSVSEEQKQVRLALQFALIHIGHK